MEDNNAERDRLVLARIFISSRVSLAKEESACVGRRPLLIEIDPPY